MTTPQAAARYLGEHLSKWGDKPFAVYNPHDKPVSELPVIYGFNNGGRRDWWIGYLIAEDGVCLGSHVCSHESYMPHDLGIVEGSAPDRHETFRKHYPDGYRMEFVPASDVASHPGLSVAYDRNQALKRAADNDQRAGEAA